MARCGCERPGDFGVRLPIAQVSAGLSLLLASCAAFDTIAPTQGFATIPAEEAAWQRVEPRLVGMSRAAVEQCAGKPQRETPAGPGQTRLVYRAEDLNNYCEVTLAVSNGIVTSVAANYAAPEFMWLRDGSNYCGRVFIGCAR